MRPEQKARLLALEEKLADQVIQDIDPENWPGHGLTLAAMDKETRGNALWARKVAAQGLMVLQKVQVLMVDPAAASGKSTSDESDVDRMTESAERDAAKLLKEIEKKREKGGTNAPTTQH